MARGRFYDSLMRSGVWDSQSRLAADLGESAVQVTRFLKASRLLMSSFGFLEMKNAFLFEPWFFSAKCRLRSEH
jgi:hypothetical protein